MTDALKTAIDGALSDSGLTVTPSDLNLITTALARRGVVVRGDGQREAKNALIRSIDTKLHDIINRDGASPEVKRLAEEAHGEVHDLAGVLSDDPAIRSATATTTTPPRSNVEAVAPVRRVVQIAVASDAEGRLAHTCLADDGVHFYWNKETQSWFPFPPIPQPGADQ